MGLWYGCEITLPILLNDETNFNSNFHSCVITVEWEHKGYQPLEDVIQDMPLENLSCVSISASLNSLALKHSYVHGDINCMISIYHSHIDVHMDFDTWTNVAISIFPNASSLLHKDVLNFDALKCYHPHIDSLCMVNIFSSHVGLFRVFDALSLPNFKMPWLSPPSSHINVPYVKVHSHLFNCNVHGMLKFCSLLVNSWYIFMHNASVNCNDFFAIMLEMYIILKTYEKFKRLVFDPRGLIKIHLIISSSFSFSIFLTSMFCFVDSRTNPFEEREWCEHNKEHNLVLDSFYVSYL